MYEDSFLEMAYEDRFAVQDEDRFETQEEECACEYDALGESYSDADEGL